MSTQSPRPIRRARIGRAASVPAAAAALVVLAAATASAHVTVHGPGAHEGGSATLTFKVPNEEANASTSQVEIDLPTDTPLSGVTAQAPAGWSSKVTADKIVFSGGKISGDDSVQFPVKVDKLPMSATVVFKALQTYSDGNVVRWIEQAPAGAPEPAHPAPTLKLLPPLSSSGSDSMAGMNMNPSSAGSPSTAAAPAAKATAKAPAAAAGDAAPSKVKAGNGGQADVAAHDDGDGDSTSAKPKPAAAPSKVRAGTGGQASEGSSVPVVPLTALAVGLGVAGLGARRLIRR